MITTIPPLILFLSMRPYGMGQRFSQFGSSVLALCPPSSSCTSSSALAREHEVKSLRICTAQEQLQHWCVMNIIPSLNPKHSSIHDTKKKIKYIPDKTRTIIPNITAIKSDSSWHTLWTM